MGGPARLVIGLVAGAAVATGVVVALRALGTDTGPATALEPPGFVEQAAAAGIDHIYDGEFTFFVGGGVAVFDCDDDRQPDLYFAGGENRAALYRNESPITGDIRFEPVDAPAVELTGVTGAYPVDIDGDDTTDLAVLRFGENVVLRGTGDCGFERANERWSIDGADAWTVAFSARWEDDALPMLAFGNYIDLGEDGRQNGTCSDHTLHRAAGPEGYAEAVALSPGWCTLSILFSDWDRSGRADLRMTNDRHYYRDGEEQLWRVAPGEPPRLYTRDEGWQKMQIWGMGIASHDLTGDGYPEVFLTSQADNKLQTLAGDPGEPMFEDIAIRRGVTAHRPFIGDDVLPSTAWHAEFQDVNNDTFVDLYVAKGNVEAMPDFAGQDPNNLLMGRADGTFVEAAATAGVASVERTRGAALVDLNLDGMLDLVEVNRREPVKVWRNVGWGTADAPRQMGEWLAVALDQPGPNRDGIGSWIEVEVGDTVLRREVTVGGGHAGGQLGWIHFGLGSAPTAEVRVQWPDGTVSAWHTVDASSFAVITRDGGLEAWIPSSDDEGPDQG